MADKTTEQMALTRSPEFMERIAATLAQVAGTVLTEPAETAFHVGRANYARQVMMSAVAAASQGAPFIVMGVNISSKTTYDPTTHTSVCTASDLELQSQVMTDWNALAGIDTSAPA